MPSPTPVLCHDERDYEFHEPEFDHWFKIRIRAYLAPGNPPTTIIVATDRAAPGDSYTPMNLLPASLATDVRRNLGLTDRPCLWIAHFDERANPFYETIPDPAFTAGERFERVTFDEQGTQLTNAQRTPISKADVEALIGQPLDPA